MSSEEDALPDGDNPLRRFLRPERSYVLVRFFLLRLLGLVYFVAFASAFRQIGALVGPEGLLPADRVLGTLTSASGSRLEAFRRLPTLLVWTGASDLVLSGLTLTGALLSLAVMFGATNALVQLCLWALYISLAKVGQIFYGYGWEMQLLETGFLSIFLCPLRTFRPFAGPPPVVAIVLFRWLIARIMLGAGLIKVRGDPCWRDLTCLVHHYETQPVPSPVSYLLHQLPQGFHKVGVLFNHLVELVLPFFAFGPRKARIIAGAGFVAFQGILIVSGNLSFLNWLTIVPAIACFDDDAIERALPKKLRDLFGEIPKERPSRGQVLSASVFAVVVFFLSIGPVSNLISPRQVMNTSFDPLELVNTYGAFGAVDRERYEVILEGTKDESPDDGASWREYEFPCKPGDTKRLPCLITPYHHRLDWQMWFAAKSRVEDEPWFLRLVSQILRGKEAPKRFFVKDPFPDEPPRYLRALLYKYRFTRLGDGKEGIWERELVGEWMRPVAAGDPALSALLDAWRLPSD